MPIIIKFHIHHARMIRKSMQVILLYPISKDELMNNPVEVFESLFDSKYFLNPFIKSIQHFRIFSIAITGNTFDENY